MYDTTLGWRFVNPALAAMYEPYSMGETAENVAERWEVGRDLQDAFALASPAEGRRGDRRRPVRRPDRPDHDPPAEGRPDRRLARRAPPRRHVRRRAGEAPAGVPRRRHGHGRQQLRHQRRRVGGAARRGVARSRAGPEAAGPRHLDRGRRRRPGDHGLRPRARDPQGARPGRDLRRRPRPRRAQRGVRLAVDRRASTSSASTPTRSTSTAGRSPWAIRWA